MKKILLLAGFIGLLFIKLNAQNVGVGTLNPTHTLHVVVDPANPNQDPVRIEGLQQTNAADTVLLVTDPTQGIIQYLTRADLVFSLGITDTDDQNIDSVILTGNILTVYIEDGNSASVDLTSIISTDDQNIDSLTLTSTILTTFIEDGNSANIDLIGLASDSSFYTTIRDSLLGNTTFTDSIFTLNRDSLLVDRTFADSIFTLTRDSLLGDMATLDSIYSYTSDSLLRDSAWLASIKDSIDTDVDSLTLVGAELSVYEDGAKDSVDLLGLASDSSFYTTIRDSLLGNTTFTDSIFTLTRDSLLGDMATLDSIYSYTSDSLLRDSAWLAAIKDSIDTDVDSLTLVGTELSVYEDGAKDSVDLLGLASNSSFFTTVGDSLFSNRFFDNTDDAWINDSTNSRVLLGTESDGSTSRTNGKQFVIADAGNVGIGTSTPTGSVSSRRVLEVSSEVNSNRSSELVLTGRGPSNGRGGYITGRDVASTSSDKRVAQIALVRNGNLGVSDGQIILRTASNGILQDAASFNSNRNLQLDNYPNSRNNDTITPVNFLYTDPNGNVLSAPTTSIIPSVTDLVDSLIYEKFDSSYTYTSDSLLNDTSWINELKDSLDLPDNDWNVNANGTGLEAAPSANNLAIGNNSIAAGFQDSAIGDNSVAIGGFNNTALGENSLVSGGNMNSSNGLNGIVIGGNNNNLISGDNSTIIGGISNSMNHQNSMILGGSNNFIGSGKSGRNSVILGGERDTIENDVRNSFLLGINMKTRHGGVFVMRGRQFNAPGQQLESITPNSMTMEFVGGYRFFTNDNLDLGVLLSNSFLAPITADTTTLGTASRTWKSIHSKNGTVQTSDIRFKTNINNLNYGLNEVMQLRPVSYNWKSGNNGLRLGFIAQELQTILPELVTVGNDKQKRLGVRYSEFIPVLTKAMQEQQILINQLQEENFQKTKLIEELRLENEKNIESLQQQIEELRMMMENK